MQTILNRPSRVLQIAAALFPLVAFAATARADIFQWEYINPDDPSQGKQQSTTLAPDGAGVDAVPGASLYGRNLTMAYLTGADLTGALAYSANLSDADLSQANLTNAEVFNTTLTNANLGQANVTNANFSGAKLGDSNFGQANLTNAYFGAATLTGADLSQTNSTNAYFVGANLTGASFRNANLTNASFTDDCSNALLDCKVYATLTDADFTDAEVRGANLEGTGFTLNQLYSTASYRAHDLTGINLAGNNLSGANFAGQNLSNANLQRVTLADADLTDADVRGANARGTGITLAQVYSTASYKARDLSGIELGVGDDAGFASANFASGNFVGQNLTDASFYGTTLTDADFTDAEIRGASFSKHHFCLFSCFPGLLVGTGITPSQLYTTASYQAHDLSGIDFSYNDLAGANFAGQILTNAYLYSATLTGADLTAADARGAGLFLAYAIQDAITTNLIRPDGHIDGLDLDTGGLLVVHDHDGRQEYGIAYPPIPITVDQHLAMAPGGTLRMVFEADAWDSTISFAPGIPVTLGGTLELTFADDVNLASQIGRTFDLFDWSGVTPTGAFAISSPYAWDLSNLYTTGEVTLTAVPEPRALLLFGFTLTPVIAISRVRRSSNSAKGENP